MAVNNKYLVLMQVYQGYVLSTCASKPHTINELIDALSKHISVHRTTLNRHLDDMMRRGWLIRSTRKDVHNTGPRPYQFYISAEGRRALNARPV